MRQLLEDYKRRLNTLNEELKITINEATDISKIARLTIKRGCYRTFIAELERIIPYAGSSFIETPKEKTYEEQVKEFQDKEPEPPDLPIPDEYDDEQKQPEGF